MGLIATGTPGKGQMVSTGPKPTRVDAEELAAIANPCSCEIDGVWKSTSARPEGFNDTEPPTLKSALAEISTVPVKVPSTSNSATI